MARKRPIKKSDLIKQFLVVRADGTMRIAKRTPQLSIDEVAFELNVRIPAAWQTIAGKIDIEMPEPSPVVATGRARVAEA